MMTNMKITHKQLRQLINEELDLFESSDNFDSAGWPSPGTSADVDKGAPKFIYSRSGTKKVYPGESGYDTASDLDFPEHSEEYELGFEDGYNQWPPETDNPEYMKGYDFGNKLGGKEERWDAREEARRMRNRRSHLTEQSEDKNDYRSYLEGLLPDALVPEKSRDRFFNSAANKMKRDCDGLLGSSEASDQIKLKVCAGSSMTAVANQMALGVVVNWIAVKLGSLMSGGMPHE